jgi:hypothetical protein
MKVQSETCASTTTHDELDAPIVLAPDQIAGVAGGVAIVAAKTIGGDVKLDGAVPKGPIIVVDKGPIIVVGK